MVVCDMNMGVKNVFNDKGKFNVVIKNILYEDNKMVK